MAHLQPRKLWEHPDPESTQMYEFMQAANARHGLQLKTFRELYAFSVQRRTDFWSLLFDRANFIYEGDYRPSHGGGGVVDEQLPMDAVPRWFSGVRLNFAENMLYSGVAGPGSRDRRSTCGKEDDRVAVTEIREAADPVHGVHQVTWGELRRRAEALARAMAAGIGGSSESGVRRGDRVVLVGANSVETLLVWLATCWLGAVFTSSSTDTGVAGILQRSAQVHPRLLFMDDATVYNGRTTDLRPKMAAVAAGLRDTCGPAFAGVIAIPRFRDRPTPTDLTSVRAAAGPRVHVTLWSDFAENQQNEPAREPLPFARVNFSDPFLICFSSGTTGTPKAIVHSVGGVLLNYYKEGRLHEDMGPDTVSLQYTTVGWIMYVATVGILLFGSRTILYDGSPFQPDPTALLRIVAAQRVTKLGIGPRWMLEIQRYYHAHPEALKPDLSSLRTVTSTGMVLSNELQRWFYDGGLFARHTQLANISGGTDIAGCFGCGNLLTPVYEGGAQGPSLGVDVRLYDTNAEMLPDGFLAAREVPSGTPGELVAVQAIPNIPCFFWNDPGSGRATTTKTASETLPAGSMVLHSDRPAAPPGSRYHEAYFARFRHVWAHGDFCVFHPVTSQLEFLGRADGVLNPSGVRFGSVEIYAVIERCFADRVADALCVGQRRPGRDNDESVLLFLLMQPGAAPLDADLDAAIREAIARDLSKRHVPRYIFPTPAIPTTINMKKVELPVKRIVCGETITPSGTLANPESLQYFYQFAEIEKMLAKGVQSKL